ncbi:MAG: MBL fold metallo-hydrolase [archaeon]|nr:MBL fold metallo-hydrolase [archaeon]
MKITTIIENENSKNPHLDKESGLSFHIQRGDFQILVDTGFSKKFMLNVKKLGINLEDIDLCIITHGHSDHGGGLMSFLEINKKAKIYLKETAMNGDYFFKKSLISKYIGLDKKLIKKYPDRFQFIDQYSEITKDVFIITEINKNHPLIKGNSSLFKKIGNDFINDDFDHELIVVLKEEPNNEITVITGCSHNHILSMIDTVKEKYPNNPIKTVLGGFHLMRIPLLKNSMSESKDYVMKLGKSLLEYKIEKIYTMHCTGMKSFNILKEVLGDNLVYLETGDSIYC